MFEHFVLCFIGRSMKCYWQDLSGFFLGQNARLLDPVPLLCTFHLHPILWSVGTRYCSTWSSVEFHLEAVKCNVIDTDRYLHSFTHGNVEGRGAQIQGARATKFCTVGPNIFGPSLRNLLHAAHLAPRILRWPLDFWKTRASMVEGSNICFLW